MLIQLENKNFSVLCKHIWIVVRASGLSQRLGEKKKLQHSCSEAVKNKCSYTGTEDIDLGESACAGCLVVPTCGIKRRQFMFHDGRRM